MARFDDFFHTGQDRPPVSGRCLRLPWSYFTPTGAKNGVGRGCDSVGKRCIASRLRDIFCLCDGGRLVCVDGEFSADLGEFLAEEAIFGVVAGQLEIGRAHV